MELQQQPPKQPEGCLTVAIRIPVRIVVLVLVVPVRLIWDVLAAAGRAVHRTVLRPVGRALAWLGRTLIVVPLVFLGTCLAWLVRTLVVVPLTWLWRYGVAAPASLLYRYVLTPLGHGIAWVAAGLGVGLAWVGRGIGAVLSVLGTALVRVGLILFVIPLGWFYRRILTPVGHVLAVVGREVAAAFGHAWRIAGQLSRAVGRALKWLGWQLVGRPVRWVWRTVCAPVAHWVRDALWAPVKRAAVEAGRAAREALTSARETVRRALRA